MQYYKVPEKLDQRTLYHPKKENKNGYSPKIPNGYFLIANELLTGAECKRINAPIELLQPMTIKKTDCYFMFGARFEKEA